MKGLYFVLALLLIGPAGKSSGACIARDAPTQVQKSPPVEKITDHLFRIGKLIVDTHERTVSCKASVNMDHGAIEYLAVAPGGKLHESLLKVDIIPLHLQLALLMLNLEPANNLKYQGDQTTPRGAQVLIELQWRDHNGNVHRVRAEDLILDTVSNSPMALHSWSFTGSRILKEVGFEADFERSLVAVWHDPAAIIDNPLPGGADNRYAVWHACPPVGTQLDIIMSPSGDHNSVDSDKSKVK